MSQTVINNPMWWHRRTTMERRLVLVETVALLVAIALATRLTVVVTRRQHQSGAAQASGAQADSQSLHDVCMTPGCIEAASQVLSKMDPDVEPCDDFYQYACGSYLRVTNIADDMAQASSTSVIREQLLEQLRNAIEDEEGPAVVPRHLQLARDLYNGCMDRKRIESRGLGPLQRILKEGLGGWPVVEGDSWDEKAFDWLQTTYRFRRAGFKDDYFIQLSVKKDMHNTTHNTMFLDEASLGLDLEFLVKGTSDKVVRAYYEYQVDLAVMLGAERDRAVRDLMESLEFEIALAKIKLSKEDRHKWTEKYNPLTVEQLQREYPWVPWLEFLQALMPPSIALSSDDVAIVVVPTYLKGLEALLSHTPKRVVANYAMWRAVEDMVPYMTVEMRERRLTTLSALTGRREREFRWKECLDSVTDNMGLSMSSIYVHKFFNKRSKEMAVEILDDIRRELLRMLQEADWMHDATRMKAAEKLQSMDTLVGYPDDLLDDASLDRFYKQLHLDPTLYLESVMNLTRFLVDFYRSRLRKTIKETAWSVQGEVPTVYAYYSLSKNSIVVPAGMLQGAFLNVNHPRYMNYGGLGYTLGSLITYSFDDEGVQFDKNGNVGDWWDPVTRGKFLKKVECIISQAGNFTDEQTGMHLNGVNTMGNNVASNGAIKEAYRAYLALESRAGQPEPRLPSLDHLSPRQMFWLAFAQTWCSKFRTERLRRSITTSNIPPDRFRVLGPLRNRPEFAEDFGCPLGSRMNPVDKCQVW